MRTCSKSDCGGNDCTGSPIQVESCNKCGGDDFCTLDKIWNNCSNNCSMSCATLSCNNCQTPDSCKPGCACPVGLVIDARGQCIAPEQCPCSVETVNLVANQIYTANCQTL